MKITKVKLFNFCQFSSLEFEPMSGTTRIYAPNGSGKTNFLRGLVYGLTGWFDPSWGNQSDLQKDGTSNPGYAELGLDFDDAQVKVRRYASSGAKTPDQLTDLSGEVILEKRQRVNAWLEERLPVSLPVMAQLMWLRQENSAWLLTSTAASINTFLGVIFDTKKLEKLRECFKRVTDTIADLRGDSEERIKHWKEVLEQLPDIEGLKEKVNKLNEEYSKLGSYNGRTVLRESDQKKLLKELETALKEKETAIRETNEKLSHIRTELESSHKCPSSAAIKEQVYEAVTELSKLTVERKDRENLKQNLEKILKQLQNIPADKCAYCGAPLKDSKKYLNRVAEKVAGTADYEKAVKETSEQVNFMTASIEELDTNFKALAQKQEDLTKLFTEAEKQEQQKEAENQLVQLNKDTTVEIQSLKQRELSIKEALVIPDDQPDIQQRLKEIKETLETLNQALNDAQVNKALAEKSIKQLTEEQEQYERNSFVKKLFVHSRDVLSQSRAQARYISSKLDTLNSFIQHYLALSEMPFILELDKEEHVFKYHMQDSDVMHPAGMLSGAQKAAASIAVQMALIETAFPQLSILLVDEADAALSPENKYIAARLYASLGNTLDGTALIISQSEEVEEACDHTWQLQ